MHNLQFKHFPKQLPVCNQHPQVIKVPLMQSIMLTEVLLSWQLDTIKKQCMISELQ